MKKHVSAICLAALLLTGCGSTATTAESSAPAAETSSAAKEESAPEKEESAPKADSAEESADQEQEFFDLDGLEMPIPSELKRDYVSDEFAFSNVPRDTKVENPVYFLFENAYPEKDEDGNFKTYTAEEIPDAVWRRLNSSITPFYLSGATTTKKTVESASDVTFLDNPAICEKGTLLTVENVSLHYVAYYSALEFPGKLKGVPFPFYWIAFTPSDDPEALDLMNRAAEAPLTLARLKDD